MSRKYHPFDYDWYLPLSLGTSATGSSWGYVTGADTIIEGAPGWIPARPRNFTVGFRLARIASASNQRLLVIGDNSPSVEIYDPGADTNEYGAFVTRDGSLSATIRTNNSFGNHNAIELYFCYNLVDGIRVFFSNTWGAGNRDLLREASYQNQQVGDGDTSDITGGIYGTRWFGRNSAIQQWEGRIFWFFWCNLDLSIGGTPGPGLRRMHGWIRGRNPLPRYIQQKLPIFSIPGGRQDAQRQIADAVNAQPDARITNIVPWGPKMEIVTGANTPFSWHGNPGYDNRTFRIGQRRYRSPLVGVPLSCVFPVDIDSKVGTWEDEVANTSNAELVNSVNVEGVTSTYDEGS